MVNTVISLGTAQTLVSFFTICSACDGALFQVKLKFLKLEYVVVL